MMKRYVTLLPILLATVISTAQVTNDTINRMVLVESTYNPIIVGAMKRNFIPEEVKPSMSKEQVIYANENIDLTNFNREAKPAQLAVIVPEKGVPGYAHLGYGNYNNLKGLAAYKFQFNKNNNLGIDAHVDGWNGKLRLDNDTRWRSYLYDMGIEVDYNIQFDDITMDVGLHATHNNYNYFIESIPDGGKDIQHANDLEAYVSIKGSALNQYYYQATVNYTYYNRSTHFTYKNLHSEGHLHSEATFSMDLYNWGLSSVLVRSDVLTYQGLTDYHNYHSLGISPRWDYQYRDFRFISGLNMDLLFGESIIHPLQISPECSISYIPNKRFTAKFTLNGGRDINSYSQLYTLSPYWASHQQVRPTYTFLNAHLSGNLRIIEGLHLHLGGGYKILSDALFETVMDSIGTTYTGIINHNAQVATVDGAINYTYKDLVSLSAKGTYNYWTLQGDQTLLARAPQLMVDLDTRVRIMPNLHAYTNLKLVMFSSKNEDAIIDWGIGAQYNLNKHFTIFLDGHNLLNHRHQYFTGYPSQGFNVLAGAIVKF